MNVIENKSKDIETEIKSLGLSDLRVSIFESDRFNRKEWQTRIEYDESTNMYLVYSLGDRASLIGKAQTFSDYESAKASFIKKLELTVKYNKLRVQRNEKPEYISELWNK